MPALQIEQAVWEKPASGRRGGHSKLGACE